VLGRQFLLYRFCPADLRVLPKLRVVVVAFLVALGCVAFARATDLFGLDEPFLRLLAAAAVLLVGYAMPVLLLDGEARRTLMSWRSRGSQAA